MNSTQFTAKIEAHTAPLRLAVLIDGDNIQAAFITEVLREINQLGTAVVKRIYGDFTAAVSSRWKKMLHDLAIRPIQQFAYTSGKNATDSMMIIDAMDLLYTKRFDGFCLISSDSDFTGLALRIREEGLMVFGFGEPKTPPAFRHACHQFYVVRIQTDLAIDANDNVIATPSFTPEMPQPIQQSVVKKTAPKLQPAATCLTVTNKQFPQDLFVQALAQASDDSGWTNIGALGSHLKKLQPDFDVRQFGYKKLVDMVKGKTKIFQYEERIAGKGKSVYVRAVR